MHVSRSGKPVRQFRHTVHDTASGMAKTGRRSGQQNIAQQKRRNGDDERDQAADQGKRVDPLRNLLDPFNVRHDAPD